MLELPVANAAMYLAIAIARFAIKPT